MFWRRKQDNDEIFTFDAEDRRVSFRVRPLAEEALEIVFDGKRVVVTDIGAAGFSFPNDQFVEGDRDTVLLNLPMEPLTICSRAEIVSIDSDGMCHCRFLGLPEECVNAIHRYMLRVQKEVLRMKRRHGSPVAA